MLLNQKISHYLSGNTGILQTDWLIWIRTYISDPVPAVAEVCAMDQQPILSGPLCWQLQDLRHWLGQHGHSPAGAQSAAAE